MAHQLALLPSAPYPDGRFMCNLCCEKGSGAVYHCSECEFDLHTHCAATEEQHTHFSHHEHPLHLTSLSNDRTNTCDGCGERVSPRAYRCDGCDYDMHSLCVRAPRFLQHRSHEHVLSLMHKDQVRSKSLLCDGCGEQVRKMTYRCQQCNFHLHPTCVTLPIAPLHAKHRAHRLLLLDKPPYRTGYYICNGCGLEGRRWVYHCEFCLFDLHPQCAKVFHEIPTCSTAGWDAQTTKQQQQQQCCSSSASGDVCAACLEGYDKKNPRKYTNCGHHFHQDCILQWLKRSDKCPLCRRKCHVS